VCAGIARAAEAVGHREAEPLSQATEGGEVWPWPLAVGEDTVRSCPWGSSPSERPLVR